MSYMKIIEYEVIMDDSFLVIRNCAGCGKKACFHNTKRFRVNANGNLLDAWLIYQCEKCKHTFNLTVYERKRPETVLQEEYTSFLNNDEQMADKYGRDIKFFKRNKAEVDYQNVEYHMEKREETMEKSENGYSQKVVIRNPHNLKIRPEKQMAEVLGLSRSQVKALLDKGEILIDTSSSQEVSFYTN